MSGHSRLSPSSRYRWAACPASVAACAKYEGAATTSAAAIDGTHSHTLLEYCIKNGLRDPKSYVGTMLQDHEGMFGVNGDRADRVRVAVDYIKSRVTPTSKLLAETRVDPAPLLGRDDMSGTVDVQIIDGRELELIDYKDGMNHVDAEGNHQLEQYAYGVLAEHLANGNTFETVRMTIIQPKAAIKGGDPIRSHVVPVSELLGVKMLQIMSEAEATDDPNAPFVPGEKQCQYCANKGNCTAFNSWTLEKSGIKFEDMNVVKDAASADPSSMSDEQLRELVEAAPLIRKMIEGAEEEALRRISNGHPVSGLKAVRGSGRRQWAFPDDEIEARLKKMHLPKEVIWQTSLISPAQIEKATWQKRDGTHQQLTEKQLAKVQSELVTKSEGRLAVVPESDRRPGVPFGNIEEMFQAVPEAPAVPATPEVPSWLS